VSVFHCIGPIPADAGPAKVNPNGPTPDEGGVRTPVITPSSPTSKMSICVVPSSVTMSRVPSGLKRTSCGAAVVPPGSGRVDPAIGRKWPFSSIVKPLTVSPAVRGDLALPARPSQRS
jgi:hypothetical protein